MNERPKPPEGYDDNPPLGDDFYARARPAGPGEAARLRAVLERIVREHDAGRETDSTINEARSILVEIQRHQIT